MPPKLPKAMRGAFRGIAIQNQASARILNKDRVSDFKVTQQGLDAILNNMMTTQGGLGRKLSGQNARTVAAMQRTSGRQSAKLNKIVANSHEDIASKFGSVIAADPNLLRNAKAGAKAGGKENAATAQLGKALSGAGNSAMNIMAQGVKGETASANHELAAALRYRAKNDAELISQQKLALAQMKLQSQLQWQEFKREQDYQLKAQQKQLDAAQAQQMNALTATVTPVVATDAPQLSAYLAEHPDGSWDEFVKSYQPSVSKDDPAYASSQLVLQRAFNYMKNQSMGPQVAISTAFSDLYSSMPGYNADSMNKLLSPGITSAYGQAATSASSGGSGPTPTMSSASAQSLYNGFASGIFSQAQGGSGTDQALFYGGKLASLFFPTSPTFGPHG